MPTIELPTPLPGEANDTHRQTISRRKARGRTSWQFVRFGLVGCVNTTIDLLVLNCLLWLWPTQNIGRLLLFNTIAYAFGAFNSFALNRYWTFQRTGRPNTREVARFVLTTLAAIACNDLILWAMSRILHPAHLSPALWTNTSKVTAIGGTILVSYLGMRLWVFVQSSHEKQRASGVFSQRGGKSSTQSGAAISRVPIYASQRTIANAAYTTHSLSAVLPAYNEEQVIASTVGQVMRELAGLTRDFEVIVVNDGSVDRTGPILAQMSKTDPRIRVVTHKSNQGYGATLADGFGAATKTLTFFMDSDGQFDIRELKRLLSLIDEHDAVIGYRVKRQDTWMRRLNAWGWKLVVRLALGVHARDIDCAFKLLRTDFLRHHPLETRGAMINAELLYKLKCAGCTIREVGVRHLPRQGGRATGANPRVIARAFRELFVYARKWRGEEFPGKIATADHSLLKGNMVAMVQTEKIAAVHLPDPLDAQRKNLLRPWQKLALGAVMLISIFVNFYQLGQSGFGNLFYAAGVKSMADSLHNFFFVSYDPGGFVTIDKPPLGFWLQAMSVKLFGFTPFSIFLPQALAGVLAVLVLFYLVRRHFGVTAGLLAGLALALSPLSVVTARNNTIDSTLAFTLLLGAWAILKAAETGKWRWLLLSATLVGIGFNVKMLEAYLVIPAFGLLYLLAAPRRAWTRIGQLLVAVLVLLAVSLSWAVVVDLTPASQRPYVGSSKDNSEISLAFGYNGVDRLLGRFGLGGGGRGVGPRQSSSPTTGSSPLVDANGGGNSANSYARRGGGGFGSGSPGPLRLFTEQTGGQISWLLPIAILGILALLWQRRPRFQRDHQQQSLLLWGTWVLTMGVFFSISSFFHQYYMTTFAPAICALFGIGIVVMWQDYRRGGWRGWLLPLAILATAAEQIYFITSNPAWGTWLIPLIAIPCALVALVLSVARLLSRLEIDPRLLMPALGLGVAALLLTPATWSAIPALQNMAISTPSAGPSQRSGFGHFADNNNTTSTSLISYLEANQGDAKYLVATPSSMSADAIILATNRPVMAMGGFAGADPILTTSQLASLVTNGTVHFFLLNNPSRQHQFGRNALSEFGAGGLPAAAQSRAPGFFGFGGKAQSALTSWVTKHCTAVPASEWQSASRGGSGSATLLYDCASAK